MPEITAEKQAEYERAMAALNAMWSHPEHGIAVKKAYKAIHPQASIPEVDAPELIVKPVLEEVGTIKTALTGLTERLDAMQVDRTNETETRNLASSIDKAVSKYRLTSEGRATLIDQMKERQSADAETVAAWMVSEIPAPAAAGNASFAPQSFNQGGLDDDVEAESMKELDANPTKWFDKTVAGMLNDPEFQALG